MSSLGFTRFQLGSLGLTKDHSVLRGFTRILLGSLRFTRVHLGSLGFTWVYSVSLASLGLTLPHSGSLVVTLVIVIVHLGSFWLGEAVPVLTSDNRSQSVFPP